MNMKTWRGAAQQTGLKGGDDEWRLAGDEEGNGPQMG
jgi:hypothetical protein